MLQIWRKYVQFFLVFIKGQRWSQSRLFLIDPLCLNIPNNAHPVEGQLNLRIVYRALVRNNGVVRVFVKFARWTFPVDYATRPWQRVGSTACLAW